MRTEKMPKQKEFYLMERKEYEKYWHIIPQSCDRWWLADQSEIEPNIMTVDCYGRVDECGDMYIKENGIRPVCRMGDEYPEGGLVGDRVKILGVPFMIFDSAKKLAIAEKPLGKKLFSFRPCKYENSFARKWIDYWVKEASASAV